MPNKTSKTPENFLRVICRVCLQIKDKGWEEKTLGEVCELSKVEHNPTLKECTGDLLT